MTVEIGSQMDRGDERPLVARLRAGEPAAFEELYTAYRGPIFAFLLRLSNDRYAAEDLFQNTWVKVSRSARRLREDSQLRAWVFTIARNEFRSYRRWQMVDVSRLFLIRAGREPRIAEDPQTDDGRMAVLETAMAELRESDREVLLLLCVEGLSQEQAAVVLGVSPAALRQRLGRARARLKTSIEKIEATVNRVFTAARES